MIKVLKFVEECVSTFYLYFNCGKKDTESMLQFCRPSIEKFLFNKLYFLIYDIYNIKFEEDNKKFSDNQTQILKKYSPIQIMKLLEVI